MKISILTGNQARHLSLVRDLAQVADQIFVVTESTVTRPWENFSDSAVMKQYFERVLMAERDVFGELSFLPRDIHCLPLRAGDLNHVKLSILEPLLESDLIIVFGSSYIRPPLVQALEARRALNLHIGVSPYYRGSACNFWALYDGRPDLVGATIHLLTSGLDSGPILLHALPSAQDVDGFVLGMLAVQAAHRAVIAKLLDGSLNSIKPVAQDRALELRYSRGADFSESVAADYLAHQPTAGGLLPALQSRSSSLFINMFVPE